jgi:ADP-ribosylation factor-binding protein GGA
LDQELAAALASAHPKIQKMCEEESDDAEAVAKLLEINDSIHRTIERYRLMKAGNVTEANKIAVGTLGTSFGVGKNAANELSLIDFDPEPEQPEATGGANGSLLESGAASAPNAQTSVEDDLLGLSLDPGPGQGLISLGGPTPGSQGPSNIFAASQQPPPPQQQMASFASPMASPPMSQPQASPKPNYDAFASLTSALPSSKPSTPQPSLQQQQKQAPVDPFAALVSASSRSTTPSGPRNPAPSNNQASLLSLSQQATTAAAPPGADDDWNFASALPAEPESNTIQVHTSPRGISVSFHAKRQPSNNNNIHITASFSNTSSQPITALHFQVAVEKSYSLQLRPQTSRELPPNKQNAVQQEIVLSGVPVGSGGKAKMRFKVAYSAGGQPVEEQGNAPSLGIQ